MPPTISEVFAKGILETINKQGTLPDTIAQVSINIHRIFKHFLPNEGHVPKNTEDTLIYIHERCARLWEHFGKRYPPIPDIFPERGTFHGIFQAPIGGNISEKSATLRGQVFGNYLMTNLDEEWQFLARCHNIEL